MARSDAARRSGACDPAFVRFVASEYRNDFTRYRLEILGRKPAACWEPVERSLVLNKRTSVASGHGIGKALAHGEPVLTPHGWVPIEELAVGSPVIAGDGSATRVIGVFPQGDRELFRVILDDGCSVVVDAEHQWLTTTRSERKHGKPGRVRTTAEIAETLTFPNGPRPGLNHQLPALLPVEHPVALLPVEPYLFGAWLGDGDARGRITGLDEQFDRLAAAGAELGRHCQDRRSRAVTRTVLGLHNGLKVLDVFGCRAHEKSIPSVYLHASRSQRIALLQGLMDTDGTANKSGAIVFEVVSERLADGVAELARSLGGVVRRSTKQGSYAGKICRLVHRLYISLPRGIAPFRDPKKAMRYRPQWGSRNCDRTRRRHIASVEPAGRGQATCIAVEHPSCLFVTRDHIVTHNTAFGADAIHWFLATRPNPAVVATANTEDQLQKKLWRELFKTNQQARNRDWFDHKANTFTMFESPTQQAVALNWSENNPEAFAGTHEEHVLGMFDEASAIARVIFNVWNGAMTTPGARQVLLGNSTQNEGFFYDATHGKLKARKPGDLERGMWNSFVIASYESPFVDPAWVEEMKMLLGEGSDEYRVRVLGLPPRFSGDQFIQREMIVRAMDRTVPMFERWPLVLGVDIGHVNDRSVMVPRRGRVVLPQIRTVRGERSTDFARRIVEEILFYREEFGLRANVVAEAVGMGVGVVETVEDMGYADQIWGINPGTTEDVDTELYANLRAYMWAEMKDWLEGEVSLPNEPQLHDDMLIVRREMTGKRNNLALETKDKIRKRAGRSPDAGDALALTFAVPFDLLPARQSDIWRQDWRNAGQGGGSWMAA